MSVTLVKGKSRKILRAVIVGDEKSSKSTIISEACNKYNGIIIDSEEGTGGMRNENTPCYLVDTFGDVIEAYEKAVKQQPGLIAIDSISPPWKQWQDHWAAKYESDSKTRGKIPIHIWNTIKRPWRQLIQSIKTSHINTIITARINYDMDMTGSEWKIDKTSWTAQAEKSLLYEMDVIIRTYIENGKYFGTIVGGRTNRFNPTLAALVGKTFENLNYTDHILPFAQDGDSGTIVEHHADETVVDEGNQKLENKLLNEAENKKKTEIISKCIKAENKLAKLGIDDFKAENLVSIRKTYLGADELSVDIDLETLENYYDSMVRTGQSLNGKE